MANYLPVITWLVSDEVIASGLPAQEQVVASLSDEVLADRWMSISRNYWNQHFLADLTAHRDEYRPLRYVTEQAVVVRPADVPGAIEALERFLKEIEDDPTPIVEQTQYWLGYGAEEVRGFLRAARADRRVNANQHGDLEAFFMYLRSQLEALELARSEGKSLFCIRIE